MFTLLQQKIKTQMTCFEKTHTYLVYSEADIKFKRIGDWLLLLYVPSTIQTNEKRDNVLDKRFAKFRAEKAFCIAILNINDPNLTMLQLKHHTTFRSLHWQTNFGLQLTMYVTGKWVHPDCFDPNLSEVCSHGIHYFNHWIAALFYYSFPNRPCSFEDDGSITNSSYSIQQLATYFELDTL